MVVINRRDNTCELCGKIDELRPYGPGGKWVCFDCAMQDEDETKRQFAELLDSDNEVVIDARDAFERINDGDSPGGDTNE